MFKKICTLLFIILFCNQNIFAQDFSNKGKEFWIAYTSHIDGDESYMGIYITSDKDAVGVIKFGNDSIKFSVTAKQITKKILGSFGGPVDGTNSNVYLEQHDGIKKNAGIKITANVPVVVYAHIIKSARSAATLVLPTPVLGTEYIIPSHESNGTSGGTDVPNIGQFAVVATKDNTIIEVTPSINGEDGRPAGIPFYDTLLKAGDCYQFRGVATEDISGTVVKSISTSNISCKPIAVFAGTTWSAFGCTSPNPSGGDNLYQQLFPVSSWGKKFVSCPFISRPADIYRIYVKDTATIVSITDNGITQILGKTQLNFKGKFYEHTTSNPIVIEANKPISVAEFITSMTCKNNCPTSSNTKSCFADPEMVMLNPVEQTLKDITFFSAHQSSFVGFQNITRVELHYVNVIIAQKFKASVKIDGANPIGNFINIPGTDYCYLQEDLTASSTASPNKAHNIVADTGFTAIVYGYGPVESYGYNGGTNIIDLYQYVTLQNEFATVNYPATCKNTPFKFSITLPYQPLKMAWDFGSSSNLTPNTPYINSAPLFDSSFIKGDKTLYVYKLPLAYTFNQIGTYNIKVTVNNPTADICGGFGEQEIFYQVEVYDPPVASFNINSNGCTSSGVTFADKSNTNGRAVIKYAWDFGDGTKDSIQRPTKFYATNNTYPIKYTIITDVGCVADTTKFLLLTAPPNAKFGVTDTVCVNGTVIVSDSSTATAPNNIVKWYWNYGDGKKDTSTISNSLTHIYTDTGTYNISLIVETSLGCRNTSIKKITIHPNPVAEFALPGNICLPLGVASFNNLTTIKDTSINTLQYNWNLGNGKTSILKSPTTNYTSTTPVSIKLIATSLFGCTSTITKQVNTIYPEPIANFGVNNEICLRDSIFCKDSSDAKGSLIVNYNWTFSDGGSSTQQSPSHLFTTSKLDSINLFIITDKGCVSATKTKTVLVNSLPIAGFTVSNIKCEKQQITFTDTSKANVGNTTNWGWNMGNGTFYNITTLPNPFNQIYDSSGVYSIKLAVTNSKGCKSDSSLPVTITINPLPKVAFSLPEVCLSDAFAQFNDSSKIAAGSFTWNWNFGDKNATQITNISSQKNPQHSYTDTGIYKVKLLVTSNLACSDSLTQSFTVNGATPKADFVVLTPSKLCSNDTVKIQNTSSVDFGNITKIEIYWDTVNDLTHKTIDDNPFKLKKYATKYTSFQQNVATSKIIYVKMFAYSGTSCVSEKVIPITLQPSPKVQFLNIASICNEATARIITEATETSGIAGTQIFSGVGITNVATGLINPKILVPNSYLINYTFTDNLIGCKDTASKNITVLKSPTAKFGISNILCEKTDVTFYDSSVANVGSIVKWIWDFGNTTNDTKFTAQPFVIKYATANTYTATLKVTTDSGCVNSVTNSIKINYLPVVKFGLPSVCLPNGNGKFIDSTTVVNNNSKPFSYVWHFGDVNDTSTSIKQDPTHRYTKEDTVLVWLQVTTKDGCIDSSMPKKTLIIYPQPKAFFTYLQDSNRCIFDVLNFYDKSDGVSGKVTQWNWTTSSQFVLPQTTPNASFIFDDRDTGKVDVSLRITNSQKCESNVYTKTVTIFPYPKIVLPNTLNFLEGGILTINPISISGNNLSVVWTLNKNDILDDSVINAQVYPKDDKRFFVKIENIAKCWDTTSVYVIVLKNPTIPSAFSPNGDNINDTWDIGNLSSYPGATISVFDRSGHLVFGPKLGYNNPWDGKLNGTVLPIGTYYYIIDPKNGRKIISGSVTILK